MLNSYSSHPLDFDNLADDEIDIIGTELTAALGEASARFGIDSDQAVTAAIIESRLAFRFN